MKFIVADDHPLTRAGLASVLAAHWPEGQVLEAQSLAEAVQLLRAHADAALALVDLSMPGMDGVASLATLSAAAPCVPLVVVSANEAPEDIRHALRLGAMGYIPKSESADVLLNAVRLVLAGSLYVPPALGRTMAGAPGPGAAARVALTPRQIEVLTAMLEGRSNKHIGQSLGLAQGTVKAHIAAIFKALNVRNRTQAARAAQAAGLVRPRAQEKTR